MKKNLLIVLMLLITNSILAQIFIGDIKWSKSIYKNAPKELKKEDFIEIKASKTFFVYDEPVYSSSFSRDEFESLIKETWTVTDYEIINDNEILEKVKVGNSLVYFLFDGLKVMGANYNTDDISENTRVEFAIVKEFKQRKKNIELVTDIFADIFISIGSRTYTLSNVVGKIHTNNDALKMTVGVEQFANYIKFVNNKILKNESYVSWGDKVDSSEIEKLKDNKLYASYLNVMGYTLEAGIKKGGTRKQLDDYIKKYKAAYDYDLVILSEKELSDLIREKKQNDENLYYITMNTSRHFKIVNIFNLDGEIIFQNYQGASWMLKTKDLKNINKAIEKGKF